MKLSVSINEDDVAFIDAYASSHEVESRSGVIQQALRLLRASELRDDYAAAWSEWTAGDGDLWDRTIGDGIS